MVANVAAAIRLWMDLDPCSAWACCSDKGASAGRKWSSPSRAVCIRDNCGYNLRSTKVETPTNVNINGLKDIIVEKVEGPDRPGGTHRSSSQSAERIMERKSAPGWEGRRCDVMRRL